MGTFPEYCIKGENMDTIKLLKEIEKKIEEAKSYLPVLLEFFEQQKGIKFTYRIKDKERILEKIMFHLDNPATKDMDEIERLNAIRDIIGFTVVIDKLEDAYAISDEIANKLYNYRQTIGVYNYSDYIADGGGLTGYKGFFTFLFDNEEGMRFEIQVTDNENLLLREATHNEFEKIKYGNVRKRYGINEKDDISK